MFYGIHGCQESPLHTVIQDGEAALDLSTAGGNDLMLQEGSLLVELTPGSLQLVKMLTCDIGK